MRIKIISISLSTLICFSGCAIQPQTVTYTVRDSVAEVDKALNTWVGASELEVMKHFGTPNNSYTDSYGNRTIRYLGKTVRNSSGIAIGNYASISSISYTYYIDFLFNNNDRIISQKNNYPKTYGSREYTRKQTMTEAKEELNTNILKLVGISAAIVVGVIVYKKYLSF